MTKRRRLLGVAAGRSAIGVLAAIVGVGLFASVAQAAQSPSIAFTPSSFSFGSVVSGQSSSETLTLKNTGGSASAALSISLAGSSAFTITANGCKGSLGPNKSCTITVTYRPTAGASSDAATLTATGQKSSAIAIATLTENSFTSFTQSICLLGGVTCTATTSTTGASVNVVATGTSSSSGTLQAGISPGTLSCPYRSGDLHVDPNTYFVLSSSNDYSKTVTIEFHGPLTVDTTEAGGSLPDQDGDFDDEQICFQAPYLFTTRDDVQASTGLLPDCPAEHSPTDGPCVDRQASFLSSFDSETSIGDFHMVVFIPAGETGDPRMA